MSAAHLAVLAWIGLRVPLTGMRPLDPPIVEARLVAPPVPPRPRPPRANAAPQAVAPYRPRRVVVVGPTQEVAPIPAPVEAAIPAPDVTLRPGPSPLPPEWDGLTDAMRTSPIGCAERDRVNLTRAERAVCDQAWGALPIKPVPLAINPDKAADFERAALEKTARRREREGSMAEPMPACSGPMSNFGVGCAPGR